MANKLVQFRASDSLRNRIAGFAQEHELTVSEACRNLIALQLERQERLVTADRLLQILQSLGYESISEIPSERLDDVVAAYLASTKELA